MLVLRLVNRFPWLHLGIGIFGNAAFFVGSLFFLSPRSEMAGVWLFIVGALGMLLGSVGELILRHGRRQAKARRRAAMER